MPNPACLHCRGSGQEATMRGRMMPCRCTYHAHEATERDMQKAEADAARLGKRVAK